MQTLVDSINETLKREFRVLDGRPIFRVVWSDDQLEVRKGKFSDWYGSILVREYTAVRQVKKYWYITPPTWVIEKLVFIANQTVLKEQVEELVECTNGSYEPVYVFSDKNGQPLELNREVVDFVVYTLMNPVKRDYKGLEAIEDKEEVKYFEEELGKGERSPLFVFENSAFVSTNQSKFKQEYKEKING